MQSTNGQIAVEPFKTNEVQTINVGGFAKVGQKHTLTPLKVVIGNAAYPAGCIVYVAGEQCKAAWASKVYKLGEAEFILMPEAVIWLMDSAYGR